MRAWRLAALLALVTAAACAHRPPAEQATARPPGRPPAAGQQAEDRPGRTPEEADRAPEEARPPGVEEGMASFYAHKFHGRRTASGQRYDMHALTCAHPRAPFGTRLKVTSLENGRSVVVVVNDRGPYARGRVVDLSLAAAKKLGMVHDGVARVRVERVERAREGDDRS
ncbi:MAG: septal ring lytic transglycosylase RlpA family protein [Anaeromyxobacter sp.]